MRRGGRRGIGGAPRRRGVGSAGSFGLGMGAGMLLGGGRRRRGFGMSGRGMGGGGCFSMIGTIVVILLIIFVLRAFGII